MRYKKSTENEIIAEIKRSFDLDLYYRCINMINYHIEKKKINSYNLEVIYYKLNSYRHL